jgi:dienelactone hydrolase
VKATFATTLISIGAVAVASAGPAVAAEPYAVGKRTYAFVDTSRPTAPNGAYAGAPTRTISTLLLYPATGNAFSATVDNAPAIRTSRSRRFPLLVFSHGFTATGPVYQTWLERFARAGYVVAAPTFPLSSGGAPGGPKLGDYVNQPADVSFVLGRVLRLARRDSGLQRTIDTREIGAFGHSLGAITTLGVAANSCCVDRRIDAAVAWAGIQLPFPGGSFFSTRTPPLLLAHGDADRTVPYAGSTSAYDAGPAPKALVTLLGAPHSPFAAPYLEPLVRSTTDWFDRYLKDDRRASARLADDGNEPGVASLRSDLR